MALTFRVPGRVNLIGEHIDYLGMTVLPMAIDRHLSLTFTARRDRVIRLTSEPYGTCEFEVSPRIEPSAPGDFANYAKAAAQLVERRWGAGPGFDGAISSTLPAAAGLSSSSALVIAVTLALLHARGIPAAFDTLMEVLPEGERYVGTQGGGMDHAACLAGREGCALRVDFNPARVHPEPIPPGWAFLIAHSLRRAEKSGAARNAYNHKRALAEARDPEALRHADTESRRVEEAILALRKGDGEAFGALLNASHASLRDNLRVSCEGADRVVDAARRAGACGARIMGAGFGGYTIALCRTSLVEEIQARLHRDYYSHREECALFPDYLVQVNAENGALHDVVQ